jgi:hypothetical protein
MASRLYERVSLTQRALVESDRRDQEQYLGSLADQTFDPLFQGVTAHALRGSPQSSLALGTLIDPFKDDPGRRDRRDMTVKSYEFTFKILKEVIGERCRTVPSLLRGASHEGLRGTLPFRWDDQRFCLDFRFGPDQVGAQTTCAQLHVRRANHGTSPVPIK